MQTETQDLFDFNTLKPTAIQELLRQYQLVLTVDEVLTIQNTILKRPPTLAELVLWSIQGSEHCSYKSSRMHLKTLVTEGPNVILGAKEDAGIVAVATDQQGKRYGIVMSHESHNHPSQIVPYEGAATGVGGNVRDVCCMGAEVIALGDGLRFGDIKKQKTNWIHEGVVAGIAGYGNPIGVPNLAGDVYYDAGYNDNCLVTVVTLGVIQEEDVIHSYVPEQGEDYIYILVGKPTDNSGFGGASFASTVLSAQNANKGAVQEPNAFLKRHLLKAHYALFRLLKDKKLIERVGFKDLGAGGIACATVELADAAGLGAEVNLDQVPTSLSDLPPSVILCSETQERFMWVVPPTLVDLVLTHYNQTFALPAISEGAQAAVIGKVRADGMYKVTYRGEEIVHAPASAITKGILYDRPFKSPERVFHEPELPSLDFQQTLLQLLAHENIASRAPIFEMYDKEVQGRTVIPRGEAASGVMQPFNEEKYPAEIRQVGIALALDHCPRFNKIDPYWGAVNAVVGAVRQVASVGATPQAITDCLCFGNPEKPEHMWDLKEAIRGLKDACLAIGLKEFKGVSLPIISGNVSLYNESQHGAIPPSPMISCLGQLPNVTQAVTGHLCQSNSELFLMGERLDECGGSVLYDLLGELGANVPKPNLNTLAAEIHAITDLIQLGHVLAVQTIAGGGLLVALAKMSFKNQIGFSIDLPKSDLPLTKQLFSETGGFVLEIAKHKIPQVKKMVAHYQIPLFYLGKTQKEPYLTIQNTLTVPLLKAKERFENGLREKLI